MKIFYLLIILSYFIFPVFAVEDANAFIADERKFYLYSPHYKDYIFNSGDTQGGDYVIEGKGDIDKNGKSLFQFKKYPYQSGENSFTNKLSHYLIYNTKYGEGYYLFVSGDTEGGDHYVESRKSIMERSVFRVDWVNRGENIVNIYNPSYNAWLFLSGDKMGGDNILEARVSKKYPSKCDFKVIFVD